MVKARERGVTSKRRCVVNTASCCSTSWKKNSTFHHYAHKSNDFVRELKGVNDDDDDDVNSSDVGIAKFTEP